MWVTKKNQMTSKIKRHLPFEIDVIVDLAKLDFHVELLIQTHYTQKEKAFRLHWSEEEKVSVQKDLNKAAKVKWSSLQNPQSFSSKY